MILAVEIVHFALLPLASNLRGVVLSNKGIPGQRVSRIASKVALLRKGLLPKA